MATESQFPIDARIRFKIREVLESLDSGTIGLTFAEIVVRARKGGLDVPRTWIEDTLNRMIREGKLEERTHPKRKNTKVYHLPAQGAFQMGMFEQQYTRDEIERQEIDERDLWMEDEKERERTSRSVLYDIAFGHAQETSFAEQIRRAAPALAAEKPVDLILEMAQWVANDLNKLADKMAVTARDNPEELQRLAREMGFRRIKAVQFFQRLWRMDTSTDGIAGILEIPTLGEMLTSGNRVKLDERRARERLEGRIFGERVVELIPIAANMHRSAVGTDASVGEVQVRHEQGSFIPPTPAVLFVASGAMRVRGQDGMIPYWDYDLDPRELEKYEDLEAAQKGFLISPRLRREAITDFRHLRSAAMELRQYSEELRVVSRRSEWHPIGNVPELNQPPEISLVIRDGRLFPLVHRLDDYEGASAPDDVLYAEVVQREVQAFHDVFQKTAGLGKLGPIYGGAVKSPEFSWFSMLTFWYLQVKQGSQDVADGFYRPRLNDQAVTHLVFWGLIESNRNAAFNDARNMMVTFRVVRRFSDIAFPDHPLVIENSSKAVDRIVDEDHEDDWIDYIALHIEDANDRYKHHHRGVPALSAPEEYAPFLDLCLKAGVVMFYGAPARMYRAVLDSRSHFLSPRWELAVDVSRLNASIVDYGIQRMLAWLVDEGGLVRDESHAVGEFDEPAEGLPLFIPDVVMQAHEMVVYTKGRHVPDVQDRLQTLVGDIQNGKLRSLRP